MAAAAIGGEARAMPRLGWLDLVIYGIGDSAYAVRDIIGGTFTMFFYNVVMGLPATLVSIAVGIAILWDALIDPWIGRASDASRSRFGRRHSFMLVGGATFGLSFLIYFSPPQGLSVPLLFAWCLGGRLLTSVTHSLFAVPYYALGAELSQDYHGRTTLTGIRTACSGVARILAIGVAFVVFFPNVIPGVDPKLSYAPYPAMGLVFGLVMTALGLASTLGDAPLAALSASGSDL